MEGCDRQHSSNGFCRLHYRRQPEVKNVTRERNREYRKRPEVIKARRENAREYYQRPEVKKAVKEYQQRPEMKKWQKEYYQRPEVKKAGRERQRLPEVKKAARERLIKRRNDPAHPRCVVQNCDSASETKGMCIIHYTRFITGRPLDGPARRRKMKVGEKHTRKSGYIDKMTIHGVKIEHRYVMEQHIGRPLLKHETVHHISGERADNRIENLELFSSSHPAGQRIQDKLKHSKEIIAMYDNPLFRDL